MTRRDRTGEPLDDEPTQDELHPPDCRRGWLGGIDRDPPVPCPLCRPWLYARSRP